VPRGVRVRVSPPVQMIKLKRKLRLFSFLKTNKLL
jgi:hypothetical protein